MFDSKYTCEAQHGKMGQTRLTGRAAFAWEGKPPLRRLARLHQSLLGADEAGARGSLSKNERHGCKDHH